MFTTNNVTKILWVVLGIFTVKHVGADQSMENYIDQVMRAKAEKSTAQLPMRLDAYTSIVSMSYDSDINEFSHRYMLHFKSSEVGQMGFGDIQSMKTKLSSNAVNRACSDETLRPIIKYGITFSHYYMDIENKTMFDYKVNKESCNIGNR